jgi:pyruvate dehydrogenase E2 component (dihydrolipoamide acetyltransferase)
MARLLRMPEVAANAKEAVLSEWPIPENIPFRSRDTIATVETEKAVVDVPADADGVILKTLVPAGALVEVGAPIALVGEPGEQVDDLGALLSQLEVGSADAGSAVAGSGDARSAVARSADAGSADAGSGVAGSAAAVPMAASSLSVSSTSGATADGRGARIFSSPLARRLAKEAGLSIADIRGSGPGGRVVRRDVEQAVTAASGASTAAAAAYEDIPHTRMRRAIAARLTQSTRDAPHFFLRGSASVDKLLKVRARLNDPGIDPGIDPGRDPASIPPTVRVSVNDLVVKAAARAHLLVPEMNVIWTPDAVRSYSAVDLSIAVATDRGLITPVLRSVDQMTLSAVASASSDLVARARSGKLQQDELEGGTMTVTNLGMFGTEEFAAIVNPPQSAILAVGAALVKPVVRKGRLRVGTVMTFTLSVDHRPIDGATAARWMTEFISMLEEPLRILV